LDEIREELLGAGFKNPKFYESQKSLEIAGDRTIGRLFVSATITD
jgi:hypothetical protein